MSAIIFHIDVNSAYLSWTAAWQIHNGASVDLRDIPSVIGGDELSRHGIVLAKSIPAKAYGIKTGNPLREALAQCPELTIVPPDYYLYSKASKAMVALLREYSPKVQQFSVDECFLDYSNMAHLFGSPIEAAYEIKNRVEKELGFTVNIGISTNKLLAKMASEFEKPNKVHTLYPEEIPEKMWPLPVDELFMCGHKTSAKLRKMGIETIGQLAQTPKADLEYHLKSFGLMMHAYANGIDHSPVRKSNFEVIKGIGNSTTVSYDVLKQEEAYLVLLSLCESVGMRLRQGSFCAGLVAISIVSYEFGASSRQRKLDVATDATSYITDIAKELLDELWDGTPIRKIGVRVSELQQNTYHQLSFFTDFDFVRHRQLDTTVDDIRRKFGKKAIVRASFLHSGLSPVTGGIGEDGYPVMTSIL